MTVVFIVPCRNAAANLPALINSLKEQADPDWMAVIIDDASDDDGGTREMLQGCDDGRLALVINDERQFALKNIVAAARRFGKPRDIIAIIDGDDRLCNEATVSLLKHAHRWPQTVAWTAHRWDINGLNISKEMPDDVNPYQWPWCSSHLKTFDAQLLDFIPDTNFKDQHGEWFKRGYDQALMLPLLKVSEHRVYVPDVCYLYNIDSCSMPKRDWSEMDQIRTVNFVRARGFLPHG